LNEQRSRGLPEEALPKVTFDESMTLHFNGETVRLMHLPSGHTDGDIAVLFVEAKVLHMGDQFFKNRFPYIDLSSGGSVEGYMNNVRQVLKTIPDDIQIIPGHGELASRKDLEAFFAMLEKCAGIVRVAIAEGQSIEDIKARGLPEEYADWGGGFIIASRWIDILYNSLSGE
jgi:glyoxylase-like metal-dependent hydrolase (beta-lactamase superfamily II)